MNLMLMIVGAAVGAPLRYLTDRFVSSRRPTALPLGTLSVNLVASLVGAATGAVASGSSSQQLQLLVGMGLCGTLSTYSTFSFETVRLAEEHSPRLAALYAVLTVAAGLAAACLGAYLGSVVHQN